MCGQSVVDKVCGDKVCVDKVCVDKVWRRAEEEAEEEAEPGIQNQKQEPHTKMWGKKHPTAFAEVYGHRDFELRLTWSITVCYHALFCWAALIGLSFHNYQDPHAL